MLGNERIGDNYFPYMALMTFNNALFYKDGAVVSEKTAAQRNLAVEDITWETTTSTDIGVDLGFLNNRLRVTADYYWKKTKDMLCLLKSLIQWDMLIRRIMPVRCPPQVLTLK